MAHLALRQHRARRILPRLAVAADERHRAGHVAETVGAHVLSRSDKQHARHAPRRRGIDAFDMRMRHRRAQHESLGHPRQHHVVGVTAPPGNEAQILVTPHGLADAEFHGGPPTSMSRTYYRIRLLQSAASAAIERRECRGPLPMRGDSAIGFRGSRRAQFYANATRPQHRPRASWRRSRPRSAPNSRSRQWPARRAPWRDRARRPARNIPAGPR